MTRGDEAAGTTPVPPLSVLMPVHDAGPYLRPAIASVLGQTFGHFELVVVDDGSTDGSADVAAEVARADSRVRLKRCAWRGVAGALNRGLAECRAPVVARMDADDLALPQRFELQLAYLDAHPDCVAVGGQVDMIDEDGDPFGWIVNPLEHEVIVAQLRRGGCAIAHTTVMFRTAAVRAQGGYDAGHLAEDVELFLRLSEKGRLANLPNHVARYRKLESAVTARWPAADVAAERRRRAEAWSPDGDRVRPIAWRPEPRGRDLQVARLGLAIHAGFHGTARKYARRLLETGEPSLWLRLLSRAARSYLRRLLRPPAQPAA